MNLAHDLIRLAQDHPERIGLTDEHGHSLTYRAWYEQAGGLAATIRAHEIQPGERVAICLPNSIELAVSIFGTWLAGCSAVPISALYNRDELERAVTKTKPRLLILEADREDPGPLAVPILVTGTRLEWSLDHPDLGTAVRETPPKVDLAGDDEEAVVLFTGGTTGEPKAVITTHDGSYTSMSNLVAASKAGARGPFELAPPEVPPNLVLLPLFHGGGLQSLLVALHTGRSVVLLQRFRVDALVKLVAEHRPTNLFLLPTMIYDLVHSPGDVRLDSVSKVLVAGQALDPMLRVEFERRFGVIVFSNYGSAEMGHVAGWSPTDVRNGAWIPGSVGRIYDGVTVEIRDDDGQALRPGESGEIFVRSTRTKGYVGPVDDGEALVVDGWVRSGDVGYVTDDRVLFLVGRRREMIKTGGFQVWPAELETELRAHPAVQDVAVVGIADERLGEIPKAFVVLTDGVEPSPETVRSLIEHTRERLAHFKMIRSVAFVETIPRSQVGKVQQSELRDGAVPEIHLPDDRAEVCVADLAETPRDNKIT